MWTAVRQARKPMFAIWQFISCKLSARGQIWLLSALLGHRKYRNFTQDRPANLHRPHLQYFAHKNVGRQFLSKNLINFWICTNWIDDATISGAPGTTYKANQLFLNDSSTSFHKSKRFSFLLPSVLCCLFLPTNAVSLVSG